MTPEQPEVLSPLVTRVLAKNPSVMTGPGTNTYVVGTGPVVVIDVGPTDDAHTVAVHDAIAGREVAAVLSTHHHSDHAPGTAPLAQRTGARVVARAHPQGPPVEQQTEDGDRVHAEGATLTALHTPGHASDHLCFLLEDEAALFSGDHIMSGSTVVIAPPDGHMDTYLASLRRLLEVPFGRIYPGHGPVIDDGPAVVRDYIAHREERREQVLSRLQAGDVTVAEIVAAVYAEIPAVLHPVARFSVLAHLHQLADAGEAHCEGDNTSFEARWSPR